MACREGTPRAPRSGQIQNRHCSVRTTPFGGCGVRRSEDRLLKCWPERQNCITQLTREGSPAGFALLQAKLPRKSSQIARGRIRRFESYMPSHAVRSLWLIYGTSKNSRHSTRLARLKRARPRAGALRSPERSAPFRDSPFAKKRFVDHIVCDTTIG